MQRSLSGMNKIKPAARRGKRRFSCRLPQLFSFFISNYLVGLLQILYYIDYRYSILCTYEIQQNFVGESHSSTWTCFLVCLVYFRFSCSRLPEIHMQQDAILMMSKSQNFKVYQFHFYLSFKYQSVPSPNSIEETNKRSKVFYFFVFPICNYFWMDVNSLNTCLELVLFARWYHCCHAIFMNRPEWPTQINLPPYLFSPD